MKTKNRKVKSVIIVLLVIIILLILLVSFVIANRKILMFYNAFGMKLPKGVSIIFEQSAFGGLGDGEGLIIYQVDSESMTEFLEQDRIDSWSMLPISYSWRNVYKIT
mgnify:CR=1 FL=1